MRLQSISRAPRKPKVVPRPLRIGDRVKVRTPHVPRFLWFLFKEPHAGKTGIVIDVSVGVASGKQLCSVAVGKKEEIVTYYGKDLELLL